MSETQRAVLRNQVALAKVFKLSLKAGTAMPVPAEWLAQSTPPPLGQPRSGVRDLVADANKFRTEWTLRLKQAAMQRQNKNNGGGAVPSGRSTPPGLPVPSPPNAQQQDHPARDSTPGYLPVPSAPEPVAGPSGLREVKVELRRGPIYTVAGPTRQNGQEQEIEGALQSAPLNANVAALIQGENQRMMER